MKKIIMIVAPKEFRDEEYFVPKKIFEENNLKVSTASLNTKIAEGKLGGNIKVDLDISQINSTEFDALVFVGGLGALIYQENEIINNLIKEFINENKLIAAICIAPTILAKSNLIKNKKMTVWNGDGNQSKILKENDIEYTGNNVEINGNFITANGPDQAENFANAIVKYLSEN